MNIESALALFAAMPAADQHLVLQAAELDPAALATLDLIMKYGPQFTNDLIIRSKFVAAVSAKADEIERLMLAEQKTEGDA